MKHRGFIWIAVILIAGVFAPLNVIFPAQLTAAAIDHIVINEVYYYNTDWENDWENSIFIELINPTNDLIDLEGWVLETNYYGQRWRFPEGSFLGAIQMAVIFPDATDEGDFGPSSSFGALIFETYTNEGIDQDEPTIMNLADEDGTGDLHFNITGDYILLKNDSGYLIDAFVWGTENLTNHISASAITIPGHSMERNWTKIPLDTDDCSVDFTEFEEAHPGRHAGIIIQTLPKQAPFAIVFAIIAILSLVVFRKRRKKN
ncbi:MAG: lamin tail domain-containing protein [Candidatus Hermodarchaeota archaeon]